MKRECELCGKWDYLERHHIFFGNKQRKISEKYGATINICPECHRTGPNAMHKNMFWCLQVQEQEQRRLMKKYGWSIQDFIKIFGKNYL